MSSALYMAASGAMTHQMRLDVLSNNLANINTLGYKADEVVFRVPEEEELQQNTLTESNFVLQSDLFPSLIPTGTRTDLSAGQLKATGNALDLSIEGQGFFTVQTPEGTRVLA